MNAPREVRAPRGTELNAKSWQTEAPLRMLMNNLDPEVAERPEDLVVYGGTGRAARSWEAFDAIVETLKDLEDDETLLVQSGKPVGVWRTNPWAPRVLIANSNLVGDWATWPEFRKLEAEGLIMYGQMTAGSWIYIATQGILQGTFETFAAIARKRFGGTLAGTLTLTGGCGGMGGAQPLAVTLNGGVCIIADVDEARLKRRQAKRYLDVVATDLNEAIALATEAKEQKKPLSVGVVGNASEVFPEMLLRHRAGEFTVDIVTDQTSAHDPLAYLPSEVAFEDWQREAAEDPTTFTKKARESMASQVQAMVEFQDEGAEVFDYGNSIRDEARLAGYNRAFEFPGFVPAYIRPLFCEGLGPFRWAALSGDPEDIRVTDQALKELFPDNEHLHRWLDAAEEFVEFEGLPARICWLGYGERHKAGLLFNQLVKEGKVKAPIVIGRDHLDSGSVASPYRETESMLDGSDAIADWPLLNALTATSSGATWVSIHHGGGVGIGRSIHAGQVCVADGTDLAAQKIDRVLTNDPGMGVIRHFDAGYDRAAEFEARMAGQDYAAGGIAITMNATRAASPERLRELLDARVHAAHLGGTTSLETKTGYGLDVESEALAAQLAADAVGDVTFLGAHVVPPGADPEDYVDLVTGDMLDAVAPHVQWIDVFCERGAFTEDQSRRVLRAGQERGLGVRVHGNQLGEGAGVALAVELGAASVDHVNYLTDADVEALAGSDTVATVLPACDLSTRQPLAPARRLLDAGATVAIASNLNPGTSYTSSMNFCVGTAVLQMGLSLDEAIRAATWGGARALWRHDVRGGKDRTGRPAVGTLVPGAACDLHVLDTSHAIDLAYRPGMPLTHSTYVAGVRVA